MKRINEFVDEFEAEQKKVYDEESNEHKDRYLSAVERAQEIDIVDNVLIQTVPTQMSFSALMIGLEKGDYIIPDFQRVYRWSERQVEELVISLLRGMPIPPIYCYRNQENQFVILDGQQRIISLYLFILYWKISQAEEKCFFGFKADFIQQRRISGASGKLWIN